MLLQPEKHRIAAVANLHKLRRKSAVVSPESQRSLVRKIGVEAWIEWRGGINAGIEVRRNAGIVNGIDLGSFHGGGNSHLRWKLSELLMCPYRPRRTTFNRAEAAAQTVGHCLLRLVGFCLRRRSKR